MRYRQESWLFASQTTELPRSHAFNSVALFVGLLLPALTLAIVGVVRAKSKKRKVVGYVTMLLVVLPLLLGLLGVAAFILWVSGSCRPGQIVVASNYACVELGSASKQNQIPS